MSHLFTIRWPVFARLEAVLLFPALIALAGGNGIVRSLVTHRILPALAPFGMPGHAMVAAATALVVIVPYIVLLLLADRCLTIRKGYAILSLAAIVILIAAGHQISWLLIDLLRGPAHHATPWLPSDRTIMLAVTAAALLLNLAPLWIGLRDRGEVAARLIAAGDAHRVGRRTRSGRLPEDIHHQQTAGVGAWQTPRQSATSRSGPRRREALRLVLALSCIGVIGGISISYVLHAGLFNLHRPFGGMLNAVTVAIDQPERYAPPASPPPASPPPVPAAPVTPLGYARIMTPPRLPTVQRPTALSDTNPSNGMAGANEAVAERGNDGGFAFDAVLNGAHVTMQLDTGATAVALRAEDAERAGIALARLNYSVPVKTANGIAEVAAVWIDAITVGNITLRNVSGVVAKPGTLNQSLLGQTFLARLAGFRVERNVVVLKAR